MTHRAETRFICDRCSGEEIVQASNSPVPVRTSGPEGWLPMHIGSDPSLPLRHLCPTCTKKFQLFMGNHE